jgi:3-phenylpropionate/trans-cinnamate dioxygenase ferredoxin reductase subunit
MQSPTILMVGAGQAGGCAAAALRREGYEGSIVLAGAEVHPPYERPLLSKGVLEGSQPDASVFLHKPGFYDEANIEWLPNAHIESIRTDTRVATMSDGRAFTFDQCLIATGGRPRDFAGVDKGMPHVHYLRSLADVADLREKIKPAASVIVIGGGFLGLEFASTVHAQGVNVMVLEAGECIMGRTVSRLFSEWLADCYAKSGFEIVCNAKIQSIAYGETGGQVILENGQAIGSDFCLIVIGQLPNVELAEAAGLDVDNGIVVDARGETSIAGIFAAGDCASHFNSFLGKMVRLESWQNAQEQAVAAARGMVGLEVHYDIVPWFWSDQPGCNIQMLGSPDVHLHYAVRGDLTTDQFIIFGFDGETLRYVLAVNKGGDIRPLRTLLEAHLTIARETLLDTSRSLREIVKAVTS